jgi:hypothetical protein
MHAFGFVPAFQEYFTRHKPCLPRRARLRRHCREKRRVQSRGARAHRNGFRYLPECESVLHAKFALQAIQVIRQTKIGADRVHI